MENLNMNALKKIAYCESNEPLNFCSYIISSIKHNNINTFQIAFTKGNLGDFNDWNCLTSANEEEIKEFENEIVRDFPDSILPQNIVTIYITISKHFLHEQNIETFQLIKWIERAIEYACFNSGMGVLTGLNIQTDLALDSLTFKSELNIMYSTKLIEILQKLIGEWGIDFSQSENTISINKN